MSIFRRHRKEATLIVLFTSLKLFICLISIFRFGFQRDEFLHLALSEHPAFGYMEVPPLISGIAWLGTHIFGDSVFASRLIPSLFGAGVIYLTGLMVLTLGGKRFAICVACLGMILSPAFLASGYLLQPVVFDQFFWVLSAYLLIQYVKWKKVSFLYWTGAAVGFGMLNKYTMLLYAASLVLGILFSGQRKLILNRHSIGAGLLAFLIFLPNLLWQVTHGLPLLKHMQELHDTQLEYISPLNFILGQLLDHATGLLIWLPGFIYLFFSRVRSRYIFLSGAYLIVMVLLAVLHGKVYYGFGAYPAMFAAGGICWQRSMTRLRPVFRSVILALTLAPALLFIPVAMPIFSLPLTLRFFRILNDKLDFNGPMIWEDRKVHATTQDYADMLGWEEIVKHVNTAYGQLNAQERSEATIFASNYGQAGAIDHLGKPYNLPGAVSLSSSYRLWVPARIPYRLMIFIGDADDKEAGKLMSLYGSATRIGSVMNPYAREKGTSVYLLKNPHVDVDELIKKYRQIKRI